MPLQNVLRNANKSLFGERPIIRPIRVEFVAVAGGGGGNIGFENGNGGGAGGVITGSFCVERDETYEIIVGDGGAPTGSGERPGDTFIQTSNPGSPTHLFGVTALGGGGATGENDGGINQNGGSGGGAGGLGLQPSASYAGLGNDGAPGPAGESSGFARGGGGALTRGGQVSGSVPYTPDLADAGWGVKLDFFNDYPVGTDKWLGQGGIGRNYESNFGREAPADNTPGAPDFPSYGRGGDGWYAREESEQPTSGSAGVVFIKYTGVPILQGGDSVVTNNGYTYHVFSSVGTGSLSFIPGKNQDNFAIDNCNDPLTIPIT
jgi:hypothetical protein